MFYSFNFVLISKCISLLFLILLFLCSSVSASELEQRSKKIDQPNIDHMQQSRKFINYLGSSRGRYEDAGTIIRDFTISGLRVRISTILSIQDKCKSGQWKLIEIHGPINKDTSFIIEKVLSENASCITHHGTKFVPVVYMNSNGGRLEDGYTIGRVFRKYGVATKLTQDQICASACAVAFLGGNFRDLTHNAQLIFHAPYTKNFDFGFEEIKCADVKSAQPLLNYFREMLGDSVGQKVFERTMDYCTVVDGWTLDSGAADFFGIIRKSQI
jgi:ATP-dependent protease ClpP protease subunit